MCESFHRPPPANHSSHLHRSSVDIACNSWLYDDLLRFHSVCLSTLFRGGVDLEEIVVTECSHFSLVRAHTS